MIIPMLRRDALLKEANFEKLDEVAYMWFIQQESKGAPVSGPVLQEKALQPHIILYPDRDSWLALIGCINSLADVD